VSASGESGSRPSFWGGLIALVLLIVLTLFCLAAALNGEWGIAILDAVLAFMILSGLRDRL
jgi:hypothetical protein